MKREKKLGSKDIPGQSAKVVHNTAFQKAMKNE
jgi:hypothetical protein